MSAKTDIAEWVSKYCQGQRWWRSVAAIAALLAASLALTATWWAIYGILYIGFQRILGTGVTLTVTAWLIIVLIFVAYLTMDFDRLDQLELESPERLMLRRKLGMSGGFNFMRHAEGSDAVQSFINVASSVLLCGPLLLFTAIRLGVQGQQLGRVDAQLMARALIKLAKAEKKSPLDQFLAQFPDEAPMSLLSQLQLFDGVVIRGGDEGSIYITDTLRDALIAARH